MDSLYSKAHGAWCNDRGNCGYCIYGAFIMSIVFVWKVSTDLNLVWGEECEVGRVSDGHGKRGWQGTQ